jgi:hypothetical protein
MVSKINRANEPDSGAGIEKVSAKTVFKSV